GRTDVTLPELELAQAGRVDDEPAAGQLEELTVSRRVTSSAGARNGTRAADLFSRQPFEQRRLADTGRAEQHDGSTRLKVVLERIEPFARHVRDGMHGHADRDGFHR